MAKTNRSLDPESKRLLEDEKREHNWKRWGPYLSERQWGTVREDYSSDGDAWSYFPHDHARSRAYRWGEDGLLGICDRQARLCFSIAMWNGRDPILKERLFGLAGPEGNHGEDVKESYFYLDSSPTHSYMRGLYKYPQAEYPYAQLVDENKRRTKNDPEFELADTGVFEGDRYFDVDVEYAKAGPDDILIRITCTNRGPDAAKIDLLPTLWFRNVWSWGCDQEGCQVRPVLHSASDSAVFADEPTLGRMGFAIDRERGQDFKLLFTENETNTERLFGAANGTPFVKDAFHEYVIRGNESAVNANQRGTKCAAHFHFEIEAGGSRTVRLRLVQAMPKSSMSRSGRPAKSSARSQWNGWKSLFGSAFDHTIDRRKRELDTFYQRRLPVGLDRAEKVVVRQVYAGLLWSRQFYHYAVNAWLDGDADQPTPPAERKQGRNRDWRHLYNRDVISMPDKWEYPWYAAWDLAFHMLPMARIDPAFAKEQLVLFLREWYMHPNGQIPAYEFALSDVNPPVHAWACWRVYKMSAPRGKRDRVFLERCFQKLLINFTWWVNRKDPEGKHIFAGGFLGLDNIGMFDRSRPLPFGGTLEQADGTAWMAFYCGVMLGMALELAEEDPVYEDVASKFFEHFVAICDAMNRLGGTGLWNEEDGFYYDQVLFQGQAQPVRVRSMVGIIPLFVGMVAHQEQLDKHPGFKRRMDWFLENRKDLARDISYMEHGEKAGYRLLAIPSRERLVRVLSRVLDENEFLSPFGIRSLSRVHKDAPYTLHVDGSEYRVDYEPGESTSGMFGGNSNWRGPIWFPLNYLLVEALKRYHHFYGDDLKVECPTGSGKLMNLHEVADEINARLARLFLPDAGERRPIHGSDERFARDPHWKDLVLFHEYFHGDDGRGLGASHQTGWTALVARCMEEVAQARSTTRKNGRETLKSTGSRAKPKPRLSRPSRTAPPPAEVRSIPGPALPAREPRALARRNSKRGSKPQRRAKIVAVRGAKRGKIALAKPAKRTKSARPTPKSKSALKTKARSR